MSVANMRCCRRKPIPFQSVPAVCRTPVILMCEMFCVPELSFINIDDATTVPPTILEIVPPTTANVEYVLGLVVPIPKLVPSKYKFELEFSGCVPLPYGIYPAVSVCKPVPP